MTFMQDADFFTLWAEEMLIEDNLVLDILFIAYYESFCTCDGKQWKKLCLLYEVISLYKYWFLIPLLSACNSKTIQCR